MARSKKTSRKSEPEDDRRLIGYMRISTEDQSMELQRSALLKAGVLEDNLHKDTRSGVSVDRPGLRNALLDAREGDTFLVWKLDRLARSLPELIAIISQFKKDGIVFKSLTEAIDTTTAVGELLFHILGTVAQFERELVRERTRAGMHERMKAGIRMGAPKKLTKEKLAEAKRLIIADPDHNVAAAAKAICVSASGLRNHLPGGVAALLRAAKRKRR